MRGGAGGRDPELAAAAAEAAASSCRAAAASLRAAGWVAEAAAIVAAAGAVSAAKAAIRLRAGSLLYVAVPAAIAERARAAIAELQVQGIAEDLSGTWPHSGGMAAAYLHHAVGPVAANAARRLARRGGHGRHGVVPPVEAVGPATGDLAEVAELAEELARAAIAASTAVGGRASGAVLGCQHFRIAGDSGDDGSRCSSVFVGAGDGVAEASVLREGPSPGRGSGGLPPGPPVLVGATATGTTSADFAAGSPLAAEEEFVIDGVPQEVNEAELFKEFWADVSLDKQDKEFKKDENEAEEAKLPVEEAEPNGEDKPRGEKVQVTAKHVADNFTKAVFVGTMDKEHLEYTKKVKGTEAAKEEAVKVSHVVSEVRARKVRAKKLGNNFATVGVFAAVEQQENKSDDEAEHISEHFGSGDQSSAEEPVEASGGRAAAAAVPGGTALSSHSRSSSSSCCSSSQPPLPVEEAEVEAVVEARPWGGYSRDGLAELELRVQQAATPEARARGIRRLRAYRQGLTQLEIDVVVDVKAKLKEFDRIKLETAIASRRRR